MARQRRMECAMGEAEFVAVDGLHPNTERIYRRLRQCVDLDSFMAGNRPDNRLSYAMLADAARWEPDACSKRAPWLPARREVECAVDEMVRAGLVERVQLPDMKRQLVLRFVLFRQDRCVQNHDRAMIVHDDRATDRVTESQAQQGFQPDDRATDVYTQKGDDRAISIDLKPRDEMDAREAIPAGWPTADEVVESGLSSGEAVAVLRGLLVGQRIIPDGRFMRAAQPLVAICRQRRVSKTEVTMAFSDAVMRGAGDPVAYAVRILERGSLVAPPAYGSAGGRKGSAPAGGQGGSAVLDYLAGVA